MSGLFGARTEAPVGDLVPDLFRLAGITQYRLDNGPGAGQRLIRIDNAAGLSVELLPDRGLDIGQVRCKGVPFGWMGPIGMADPARLRGNQPLSGLMSTCGFDHIRQPETDQGHAYPLHGGMVHQPATVLMAAPVDEVNETLFRIEAEVTQYALDLGGIRLRRRIDVPLDRPEIRLHDEVRVIAGDLPVMAMYHINLGYPLAGPQMRLDLNGADITDPALGRDGVRTRPAGQGQAALVSGDGRLRFGLRFDPAALPVFQTLCDARPGVNLVCLEPASHDRQPRASLRQAGALAPVARNGQQDFRLVMDFSVGE